MCNSSHHTYSLSPHTSLLTNTSWHTHVYACIVCICFSPSERRLFDGLDCEPCSWDCQTAMASNLEDSSDPPVQFPGEYILLPVTIVLVHSATMPLVCHDVSCRVLVSLPSDRWVSNPTSTEHLAEHWDCRPTRLGIPRFPTVQSLLVVLVVVVACSCCVVCWLIASCYCFEIAAKDPHRRRVFAHIILGSDRAIGTIPLRERLLEPASCLEQTDNPWWSTQQKEICKRKYEIPIVAFLSNAGLVWVWLVLVSQSILPKARHFPCRFLVRAKLVLFLFLSKRFAWVWPVCDLQYSIRERSICLRIRHRASCVKRKAGAECSYP